MDIQEYISDTLIQIIAGVKKAQDYATQNGAIVNAGNDIQYRGHNKLEHTTPTTQEIEFDILVTTSDNTRAQSGVQVLFPTFLGTGGVSQREAGDIAANRVRFTVPVIFPEQ